MKVVDFMQLARQVSFLKALGDSTRIKILHLLAGGPLHGQAIAGKLGLTPPTITHHLTKLREAGVVVTRREKNTIYFSINEKHFRHLVESLTEIIEPKGEKEDMNEKMNVLKNFLTNEGTLKTIPAQRKKKLIVLAYLVEKLTLGKKYEEKEINEFIRQFHPDFATIRREFINHRFMYRENNVYEVNPKELWMM